MRIPQNILLLFVCTCCSANVFASNGCGAGKYKDPFGGCASCQNNFYCPKDNNNTLQCPDSHPKSDLGATSINECYKECTGIDITGGSFKTSSINLIAYYNTKCEYTVSQFTCAAGSAKNPTMNPADPVTDDNKDNICIQKIECYKLYGKCKDGEVWGYAKITDDKWDYSDCRCRQKNQKIDNGTGICGYHYKSGTGDTTEWSTTCTPEEVTECDAGYCQTDKDTPECKPAPTGYYSPAQSTTCEKCPIGSTTDGGAENITKCYITPNSTKNTTYFRNAQ